MSGISKSAFKFRIASALFWFSGLISVLFGLIVGITLQSFLTGFATGVTILVLCEMISFWLAYDFANQEDSQI